MKDLNLWLFPIIALGDTEQNENSNQMFGFFFCSDQRIYL